MVGEQAAFEAVAKPARWLVGVGFLLFLVVLVGLGVSIWIEEPDATGYVVLALSAVLVVALSAWLALTPVRTRIDRRHLTVSYWPFKKTVPLASVQEVLEGDRVDGFGHGYGYRWEGKGRIAFRIGGPMITVIHDAGRLGVSVPDPQAALAAAKSALRAAK